MNAKHAKLVRKLAFRICVMKGIDPGPVRYVVMARKRPGKKDAHFIAHDPASRMGVYRSLKRNIKRRLAQGLTA